MPTTTATQLLTVGEMYRVTKGQHNGSVVQLDFHEPDSECYTGKARCVITSSSGNRRNEWIEVDSLRPCNQLKATLGEVGAIATVTPQGTVLDIKDGDSLVQYHAGKILKTQEEVEAALEEFVQKRAARSSVVEEPEESLVLEEEDDEKLSTEPEEVKKSNVLQFMARSSVVQEEVILEKPEPEATKEETPSETVPLEPTGETEEEDWIYISPDLERKCETVASQIISITQPYAKAITQFLWELKFVVFEDDHRRKSRKFGTFEQMCRHLHQEHDFPLHPNTARERANAEQERRTLRQLLPTVEVETMSDHAALELRRIDSFKGAEPEVILEAKKAIVKEAPKLTQKAIADTIKSMAEAEDWEDKYRFRYNPKPKNREQGEKPEPISRKEVEDLQNRNAHLNKQVQQLQSEVTGMISEMMHLKEENDQKARNEKFLADNLELAQNQLSEKDQEIERLKQELEEARRMRFAG